MHEFTFECMIHDLLKVRAGSFVQLRYVYLLRGVCPFIWARLFSYVYLLRGVCPFIWAHLFSYVYLCGACVLLFGLVCSVTLRLPFAGRVSFYLDLEADVMGVLQKHIL